MPTSIRIALAQTCPLNAPSPLPRPTTGSPSILAPFEKNLEKAAEWIVKASKEGAEVVVFPEYFLQGIVDGREYMVHPAQHAMDVLSSLAKTHDISIVGTIVRPRSYSSKTTSNSLTEPTTSPFSHILSSSSVTQSVVDDWNTYLTSLYPHTVEAHQPVDATAHRHGDEKDRPMAEEADFKNPISQRPINMANTAFFIEGGTGNVIGKYEKKNLWIPERDYLVAGDNSHEVFETKWGKAGLLICWDLSRAVAAADLAKAGVDIIFAPTYWMAFDSEPGIIPHSPPPGYERSILRSLSYTRAFETETALIMLNAGGKEDEGFIGGSGVWMPFKGLIHGKTVFGEDVTGDRTEEGLEIVEVDLGVLRDSRNTYQIRADHKKRIGSLRS